MRLFVNGQAHDLPAALSLSDLLLRLELTGKRIAVERNGEVVPKSRHGETLLGEGDKLEIIVAVGGG